MGCFLFKLLNVVVSYLSYGSSVAEDVETGQRIKFRGIGRHIRCGE